MHFAHLLSGHLMSSSHEWCAPSKSLISVTPEHTNYVRYIPVHQAHEQNNACSKRDGGAVGLTDNPSALQRWLVAGPEVTALIKDFEGAHHSWEDDMR